MHPLPQPLSQWARGVMHPLPQPLSQWARGMMHPLPQPLSQWARGVNGDLNHGAATAVIFDLL